MASAGPTDSVTEADGTWASCLVLVAAYDDVAPAVGQAVDHAQARLTRSPALDDFIELRSAAVGPRPAADGAHDGAVDRIAAELAHPTRGAPENFLALVVVDDLAPDAAALLAAAEPAFAGLPFAVPQEAFAVDGGDTPVTDAGIVGFGPRLEQRLGEEILRFCGKLMRDPSATSTSGVPAEVLQAALTRAEIRQTLAGLSMAAHVPAATDASLTGESVGAQDAERAVAPDPVLASVFVGILGAADGREAGRLREVVVALDAHLAEQSDDAGLVFEIGVAVAGRTLTPLQPTGQLSGRDLRSTDDLGDTAEQLTHLADAVGPAMLEAVQHGRLVTRPAVVLATLDAPTADPVSRAAFERLTHQATVTWLLLGDAEWLLSPAYRKDAVVVTDSDRVIEDTFDGVLLAASQPTALSPR